MTLSMVNFVINLTVCQPHDLKDRERDGRDSATSADNSMGGAGVEKYSESDSVSSRYIPDASATQMNFTLTQCLSYSIRKWHLLLFPMVSTNVEEESNGRDAEEQEPGFKNRGLKPHMI